MPVKGHEVEIPALLKKLKLRTRSSTLCKRRKKKKSCTTRFERDLKRVECSVSYGGTSGIAKKSEKKVDQGCGEELETRFGLPFGDEGERNVSDNRVLEKLEVESGGYSISVHFRNCANGFYWIFSGVYGSVIGCEKEDFWEELGAIRGLWEDPWCIGGDFNTVRFLKERRNAPRLIAEMRRFSEVIGELGLRDFPLAGGPFTWIGGLNSQASSRLDRFLISDQWEDHFSAITQSALPHLVFDHNPIVLEARGFSSGKSPFKLKALKKDLKNLNKEVVGNVSFNRAEAFSCLQCWEAKENENSLTPREAEAKKLALKDYKKWAILEETSWRQKSREIWLREGDKNTRYFHKMANARARRNFLSKIKVNEVSLSFNDEIKEGVCKAYQSLLSESGDWRPSINGLNFKKLGEGLANSLEVIFFEEEIFAALSSYWGDKAPGPDGFTMAFWLFCWDVIKSEILGLFSKFYIHGTFQRSLNSTFLVLIPKKEGAEDLRDFIPISLVGSVYKLLAKVLANRLKLVMGEVISDSRQAFVQRRQILDVVLIASEALDSRLKDNTSGLLFKMDIEKAFDHVNWDFLMDVMSRMGFGHRWINWMKWCCSTATSQSSSMGALRASFVVLEQLEYLSWTFMWFEAISGLKVNLSKTEAIPVGEGIPMETLASVLGCKIGSLPTSYLGLPLGAPYKSTRVWDIVEERFRKRLYLWKRQYLSKGGPAYLGVRDRYGVGVWKAIKNGWENFRTHSRFIVGDGIRVKFWKDLWCENQSLEDAFPNLFNLTVNKEGWVAKAWEENGVMHSSVRRNLLGWHGSFVGKKREKAWRDAPSA
ncbi:Transposon TX1 uncharacterized 149 kDa protein [Vitis vinifera]|uniref:Transposon TX1 uncharacterized 149 kDa protein n=1 Tax=Vitis vinifera TaxID=29760 RepID=A0A438DVN3_VITVI|nr:Transposon TX1 uncharacterized 149 kDa protein [Vitis vinifera]